MRGGGGGFGASAGGGGVDSRAGIAGQITDCPMRAAIVGAYARGKQPPAARQTLDVPGTRARLYDAHPHTRDEFMRQRRCTRCALFYCELENVGTWNCTTHIGLVDAETQRWSCCGRPAAAGGCRHSDHVAAGDPAPAYRATRVPMFVPLEPPPRAEAVLSVVPPHYAVDYARAAADRQPDDAEQLYAAWERNGNVWTVSRADAAVRPLAPLDA